MTIEEIKVLEGAREDARTWNVIHFVKEGDFYRAHDWSAWLMTKFPFGEAVEKPLKIIAKKLKDGYIDAFLGFPASSIGKYIPQGMDFVPINDNQFDVTISLPAEFADMAFEDLNKMKDEWKASLPFVEGKKQRREDREIAEKAPRITRFSDIISHILSIPLEEISPREAYDILRDLRRQVASLF